MTTTATAPATAALIVRYREAATALRRMDLRAATGLAGRNAGATLAARERHGAELDRAVHGLIEAGERDLLGVLVDEHDTAARLADAHLAGQARPELDERLAKDRAALRLALVAAASA